jgi:hypothetical protein
VLDADETPAMEAHLAACPACRAALEQERETVDALAWAAVPAAPSASAKARLSQAIAGRPAQPEPIPLAAAGAGGVRPISRFMAPLAAAAAVLLLIGAGVLAVLLERALDERDEARSTAQLLATYVSSGGRVVAMDAREPSLYKYYKGQGSLLIAPGMDPVLVVAGCPESGDGLNYWVWLSRDGERVPAGQLTVGSDGSGWLTLEFDQPLSEFDMVGVTLELSGEGREDVLTAPLDSAAGTQG